MKRLSAFLFLVFIIPPLFGVFPSSSINLAQQSIMAFYNRTHTRADCSYYLEGALRDIHANNPQQFHKLRHEHNQYFHRHPQYSWIANVFNIVQPLSPKALRKRRKERQLWNEKKALQKGDRAGQDCDVFPGTEHDGGTRYTENSQKELQRAASKSPFYFFAEIEPPRALSQQEIKMFRTDLKNMTLTVAQVAKIYGISEQRVHNALILSRC
jgi:hypothetical protein